MTKDNETPAKATSVMSSSLSPALFRAQRDLTQSLADLQAEISRRFKQLNDEFAEACASTLSDGLSNGLSNGLGNGLSSGISKLAEAQNTFVRSWNQAVPEAQQEYTRRARELYRKYIRAIQDAVAHANLDQLTPMELAMAGQLLYTVSQQALGMGFSWAASA